VAQQQKQCGVLLILRPAPPHNMTQNGRRKKPDKWRELLKEAEQLSAEKAAEVELLMQVQVSKMQCEHPTQPTVAL
jgi:hypothetical protein